MTRPILLSRALLFSIAVKLTCSAVAQVQPDQPGTLPAGPVSTKRYTWVEVESSLARLRTSRVDHPQLQSAINEWYIFTSDPAFTESQDVPEHCIKLAMWKKARPDSPIPLIAHAKALMHHAWHLRGNGFAATVPAGGQESFRKYMAEARELLDQAIKLGVNDGEAHSLLLGIARAEGRSLAEARAILNAGRTVDASYPWLYSAMAEYLLPRWYGSLGDVEKFAAEVVQMVPGDDGLDAYGHIAYVINQYDGNVLFWGSYDRELLVKAAEVLVRRYPTAANVVPFAALCTLVAGNHAAAVRIRPFVTSSDVPRVKLWKHVAADYYRWCAADEVASGQCQWLWGTPQSFGNLAFAPDSQSIWCATGLARSAVTLLDTEKKTVAHSFPADQVYLLAFDPEKKWLVGALSGQKHMGWSRWSLDDGKSAHSHPTTESCRAIAINPKRQQIVWAESKTLHTFDFSAKKEGPTIDFDNTIERLRFSSDGKLLAVAAGPISVWDAGTGKKRYTLPSFESQPRPKIACDQLLDFDDQARVWATAFVFGAKSPQRPLVRFAPGGKTWDTVIPNLTGMPASATLSPDRKLLAIAENNNDPGGAKPIQIWDVPAARMRTRLPGHHNHIGSLAFSPDGKRLASLGYLGGPIKLWSLDQDVQKPRAPAKKDLTL